MEFARTKEQLFDRWCSSKKVGFDHAERLERFHQTLKNMIRSYCFDTEKDWDEGIHLLLFAVRESVQKSLGFSPFELYLGILCADP